MASNSQSSKQSYYIEHLGAIFRIQELFGLRPFEVQPTGPLTYKLVTLPLGIILYIAHGVLFVYCLIYHYHMTSVVGSIAKTKMALAQEIVSVNIHIVMYILYFVGMTLNLRLLKRIGRILSVMNEHFERIGIRRKAPHISSKAKFAMIWYCFGELLMFAYYLYFQRPSMQKWLPDYSMHLVPSIALQCSIWSYMMYVTQLKIFQDYLNNALVKVARSEMERPVKMISTTGYVD